MRNDTNKISRMQVLRSLGESFPLNTTGMNHLKILNASRGPIHEYENLKGEAIQL